MNSTLKTPKPVALTIAGLDPSGGAGAIADIRTFVALGCFPTAALTSITFQNTIGVFGVSNQTPETVCAQVDPIIQDYVVAGVKTGMLPTAEIVSEVARLFRDSELPAPVVDPVMVSTSGHDLIGDDAARILRIELLPLARIVTPNIPEAERLAGFKISNEVDMRSAAEEILGLGVRAVLVKGGHMKLAMRDQDSAQAYDLFMSQEGTKLELREDFVDVGEVHGSGCTLSAAIASFLAQGESLEDAVRKAKNYVTQAIRALQFTTRLGHGARPL